MGKQHKTFPGEPEEMPDHKDQPEIKQPHDPDVPEIPQETPDTAPDELPPEAIPGDDDKPVVSG